MQKGSISIYFVKSALEPVIRRGLPLAPLLQEAGIAPALLQSAHGRVSAASFSTLWLGVARLLDDELFDQDSRRMKVGSFAMLVRLLVHSPDLASALRRMCACFNLILDDFHSGLEGDARQAMLVIRHASGPGMPRVFGLETLLILQFGLACWLVGRRLPIRQAAFAYPEPEHSAEYRAMYSENLRFGAAATTLAFDPACLALPVIQDASSAEDFLRAAPANIVLKYKNSSGLSAQIRRRLRGAARSDWPDFDSLARALNMAPATLRRRLDEEGQSFQGIKDQLRHELALDYLRHSTKSILDISGELGFADASAFHRAFKRWTGARPGEYRRGR